MFSVMTKCFHQIAICHCIFGHFKKSLSLVYGKQLFHNICEKKFDNQHCLFCHLILDICTQVFCLLQVFCQSTPNKWHFSMAPILQCFVLRFSKLIFMSFCKCCLFLMQSLESSFIHMIKVEIERSSNNSECKF